MPVRPYDVADPLYNLTTYLCEAQASGRFPQETGDVRVMLPRVEMLSPQRDPDEVMRFLESAIRTAWKSEGAIDKDSHKKIIRLVMSREHESTLEHLGFTFRIICNRGVSHELVRHRIASYTQESTRYVNYEDRKSLQAIMPWYLLSLDDIDLNAYWVRSIVTEFGIYTNAMRTFKPLGIKAQDARDFLPNACKTEVVTTMNIRSWRNFFKLRTAPAAHPDMQIIARELLRQCMLQAPILFEDIYAKIPVYSQQTQELPTMEAQ